jgi:hypothetical protein
VIGDENRKKGFVVVLQIEGFIVRPEFGRETHETAEANHPHRNDSEFPGLEPSPLL